MKQKEGGEKGPEVAFIPRSIWDVEKQLYQLAPPCQGVVLAEVSCTFLQPRLPKQHPAQKHRSDGFTAIRMLAMGLGE